jgi:hypothetical protein
MEYEAVTDYFRAYANVAQVVAGFLAGPAISIGYKEKW